MNDNEDALVRLVRSFPLGSSVESLVGLGRVIQMTEDQVYEAIRLATQHGKIKFDAQMNLVPFGDCQ